MRFLLHLFLVMSVAWSASIQANDKEAVQMLERMTEAAKNLTYEGVFAYQSGKTLQSIRIFHRADARGEVERLISLNGAAREVIRSNDMVTCINPEGKQVNVSRRPLGRGFPSDLPRRLNSATPYYEVGLGDTDRVAGRQAHELIIKPLDNYRYGYRLWVDIETGLLLKSELRNDQGEVLETFAFSSVSTSVHIPEHKLKPQMNGEEMTWHRSEPETPMDMAKMTNNVSQWRMQWLPEGFALVAQQTRLRASNGAAVEQRVYSDGLSSVSIFIEKIRARHDHLNGGSHVGAINAYGTIMHAHFVTVVGEVPAVTVEKIGNAITHIAAQ
ncbi:Sigma factor RpoE negative regulatory protein RseB precursor [Methylophaga thiooxydans]|uniref:Sigma factor RpoE negative regulatory protein RseB n=1 Tax=Methylophaga thiooxydans TaxID=392484 RepID=A0A0A0BEA6_9GAMM|nr:MucB/RseB C-terminal domain-containing protein [Methylophaga thiooxydans]KGM06037.1 Sigma factor RpoE negative regulatory protein RseB precursor [Methylophaga thiooxydans]